MGRASKRTVQALAALLFAFAAAAAGPVAFVSDVEGEALIAGGAGNVEFLGPVAANAVLVLRPGARVSILFTASGIEYTLNGPGEFLVGASEVKSQKGPAPVRRNIATKLDPAVVTRVSEVATASLRMRGVSPPARAARPGPAYPRNTQVATLQPVLRWEAEPDPRGFSVSVLAADGKVVWKGASAANSLRLPVRLAPATRYSWNVSLGGASLGEALFETMTAEAIERAEKSRAAAKSFPERVHHALVLRDLGAHHDERELWAALARERPDLPALAVLAR